MEQDILLEKGSYTLASIEEIEIIEEYNGDVFDIEVKDDHTFYVSTNNKDFVLTHNSSFPDVDLDFEDKEKLTKVLRGVFGDDNVISISNYNTLQLRSLIKDISKFYGIPFQEVNQVTRVMDNEVRKKTIKKGDDKNLFQLTLKNATEHSPSFQEFIAKYPDVSTHITALYQNVRSISRHAGGIIICDDLDSKMPVIISKGERQSPWTEGVNYKHLEEFGFLKFDCLGLLTLRIMRSCIEKILISRGEQPTFANVRDYYNKHLHPDNADLENKKVFKNVWWKKRYPAIFQFTSVGAQKFATKFKPLSVEDISSITSIYRPGPLAADVDKVFLDNKKYPEMIEYEHPAVKEVLESTSGCMIYQEQVMAIANKLAGLTLPECDLLRKVILKRTLKGQAEAFSKRDKLKIKFIDGCVENGLTKDAAEAFFQKIEYCAGYLFNRSHSIGYSLISYQCAWLFTHFEKEWLQAYLENKEGGDKKERVINEIKKYGYEFKKPDVNTSTHQWEIDMDTKTVYFSLSALKGMGKKAVANIVKNRPYENIDELLFDSNALNKKSLEVLVKVGALDSLDIVGDDKIFKNYKHMYDVVIENFNKVKHKKKGKENFEALLQESLENNDFEDWDRQEKIEFLSDIMGTIDTDMFLTPLVKDKLEEHGIQPINDFNKNVKSDIVWFIISDVRTKYTKNNKQYAVINALGEGGTDFFIRHWGANSNAYEKFSVYAAELNYDPDWGFSMGYKKRILRLS